MYVKMVKEGSEKRSRSVFGKGGFTLVELSVVIALVAILATMTVSFSVFMSEAASESSEEYKLLEDCASLKNAFSEWSAEMDVADNTFKISANGTLSVVSGSEERTVLCTDGTVQLGEKRLEGLDTIDGISFSFSGNLIKCVIYHNGENGKTIEKSFVCAIRCADIREEAANE